MMTAEDVAEVVVFALERPRHFRMLELGAAADDGVVMGLASPSAGASSPRRTSTGS